MERSARLKRLVETQQRVRDLEQLELIRSRAQLAEAEAARDHVLGLLSGPGSPGAPAWLAVGTGATTRSARDIATAIARVAEREAALSERAMGCQLVAGLHAKVVMKERALGEAAALTEILERVTTSEQKSAAQD